MSTYTELFKNGANLTNGQSFFSYNNYNSLNAYGTTGIIDNRAGDIQEIVSTLIENPITAGIYTKIKDLVCELNFNCYEILKNGTLKKSKPALEYTKQLIKHNLEKDIDYFLVARYGGGLGNGLAYKVKNGKNIELKFEPFVVSGFNRVEIVPDKDYDNLDILKYNILNKNQKVIYTFKADQVYHYSYLNITGDPAFGHNPIVTLAKYLRLFKNIFKSQDAIFSGGMQASKFFSIDMDAMIKQGVSEPIIAEATQKLIEDLKQANGIINRNKLIVLNYPLKSYDIQMNNSEMRTPELLPLLIQLFHNAFGVDPSILDISKSKYDNAEVAKDALYQQIRPFTMDIEKYVERWKLPNIDKSFDKNRFIFRFERQYSEEEIRIKDLVGKQTTQYFNNLKIANETFSDINVKFLPTEDKLKFLEENGFIVKTLGIENINIKPSAENQVADSFTQISNEESIYRKSTSDKVYNTDYSNKRFYDLVKSKIDKSFQKVLEHDQL